jgi:hypothetical protein
LSNLAILKFLVATTLSCHYKPFSDQRTALGKESIKVGVRSSTGSKIVKGVFTVATKKLKYEKSNL